MFRTLVASVVVSLALSGVGSAATEPADAGQAAPDKAVAAAWAQEAKGSSTALHTLFATYAVVQSLDMASTIVGRNRGAVEANPVMGGGYARGIAIKAMAGAVTVFAVHAIEKKNKKAALMTMIALNVATAAVVANNMRVARRLR